MKNLILIRHAKSSWEAPLKDMDRPLSKRGIGDSHLTSHVADKFLQKTFAELKFYSIFALANA